MQYLAIRNLNFPLKPANILYRCHHLCQITMLVRLNRHGSTMTLVKVISRSIFTHSIKSCLPQPTQHALIITYVASKLIGPIGCQLWPFEVSQSDDSEFWPFNAISWLNQDNDELVSLLIDPHICRIFKNLRRNREFGFPLFMIHNLLCMVLFHNGSLNRLYCLKMFGSTPVLCFH